MFALRLALLWPRTLWGFLHEKGWPRRYKHGAAQKLLDPPKLLAMKYKMLLRLKPTARLERPMLHAMHGLSHRMVAVVQWYFFKPLKALCIKDLALRDRTDMFLEPLLDEACQKRGRERKRHLASRLASLHLLAAPGLRMARRVPW